LIFKTVANEAVENRDLPNRDREFECPEVTCIGQSIDVHGLTRLSLNSLIEKIESLVITSR